MSENNTEQVENTTETTNNTAQENLLFADTGDNVKIQSGGTKNQPDTNVSIEPNIINNTLRYMLVKSAAWANMHQSYIHLSLIFMNRTWYGENELATKLKDNFKQAPFTVDQTKQCLDKLAKLGVLETKSKKGKTKYMLSEMGVGLIWHDKLLLNVLGIQTEPPKPQPEAEGQNQGQGQTSTDGTGTTAELESVNKSPLKAQAAISDGDLIGGIQTTDAPNEDKT